MYNEISLNNEVLLGFNTRTALGVTRNQYALVKIYLSCQKRKITNLDRHSLDTTVGTNTSLQYPLGAVLKIVAQMAPTEELTIKKHPYSYESCQNHLPRY